MARRRDIDIRIAPDGRLEVHVKGMPGKQCLEVKAILENLVGGLESQRLTPEYYEAPEHARLNLERR
ncbi:MAG TPA: DUF2997 domain-containing protein [Candidatus Xenobia bacterium]|jgi:hypothetical protein